MKLTNESKKSILNSMLTTIAYFSDRDYQKKNWLIDGVEKSDFEEVSCMFFEDSEIILENNEQFKLSNQQYNILKKFTKVFDEFSEKNEEIKCFIDTQEWKDINKLAKEVLDVFHCDH